MPEPENDTESVLRIVDDEPSDRDNLLQALAADERSYKERWDEIGGRSIHPFDRPELRQFYEASFPDDGGGLESAVRPGLSESPDDLELWESTEIARRRDRITGAELYDRDYVQRTLYEELFSVNQFPTFSDRFVGNANETGMTPGGLVSHYYFPGNLSGFDMERLVEQHLSGDTFGDALLEWGQANPDLPWYASSDLVAACMKMYEQRMPDDGFGGAWVSGGKSRRVVEQIKAGKEYPDNLDSISLRLIQMLQSAPEMMEPVQDQNLIGMFSRYGKTSTPRAMLVQEAWHAAQGLLIQRGQSFIFDTDISKLGLLGRLFHLRTHPEMQVFFRYLSPSGYINAARNSAQGEKPLE